MYAEAKTWNPFKGCEFDCTYCRPSFQALAKWQKQCPDCVAYRPHEHPERLIKIPNAPIIFVCGNGDLSFCRAEFTSAILERLSWHRLGREDRITYYLQSKRPEYFAPFIEREEVVPEVVFVTTLETNRDEGYEAISRAPPPIERLQQFAALPWPHKVVTAEPVMDFDLGPMFEMIASIRPDHIWIGYNSRPRAVQLPEPPPEKVMALMERLTNTGIEVRGKDLRGLEVPSALRTGC
jgi:hypothetical protein